MAGRPSEPSTAVVVASAAGAALAKPKDDSDEWRFLRFLELRRHERKKIQQEQDMQRLAKSRKVGEEPRKPVLALPEKPQQGRPGKVMPPPAWTMAKTSVHPNSWGRTTGADLDASIRKAMNEQQKEKAAQRGKFSKSLQVCMSADQTVAASGMPKMVKLMEATALPHERIQLLTVLEKTALLPDGTCWTKFVELKATAVLRQWIAATAGVQDGALEGESDKIVCACLNVLMRLNMSFNRAQAEGLVQACENIGAERSAYVRKVAGEVVRSWQQAAIDEEDGAVIVEEADGSDSSDSGSSSSSSSGSGAAESVLASALAAGKASAGASAGAAVGAKPARQGARKPAKAAAAASSERLLTGAQLDQRRKEEAETQRTLDSLLELGKMLDPALREDEVGAAPGGNTPASGDGAAPRDAEVPRIAATEDWEDPDEESDDDSSQAGSGDQLVLGSDDGDSTDHG